MAFFKKRKHPLPKFPGNVIPLFKGLCEVVSDEAIAELKRAVEDYYRGVEKDLGKNPYIDIDGAAALRAAGRLLLEKYPSLSEEHKRLAVGAVRYFAIAEDALDENTFTDGFRDDKQVVNYVLEELGIEDHFIELE